MDSFSGSDLNGAFKIANLAVAALAVCENLTFGFSSKFAFNCYI